MNKTRLYVLFCYCRFNANEISFICGGKHCCNQQHLEMCKTVAYPRKPMRKNRFLSAPGKGLLSHNRGQFLSPPNPLTHAAGQKMLSLLNRKHEYEIHKRDDIYTG